jgi:hypothetical protein
MFAGAHVANTRVVKQFTGVFYNMGLLIREQEERNLVPGFIYSLENVHETLGELLNHAVLCCPVM